MRLGRIECGVIKGASWKALRWFEYYNLTDLCGCKMWCAKIFYLTWLNDECYYELIGRKENGKR